MKTIENICGSSNCFKYFVAGWAFLETFSLGGLKTGWPSLVYVFKQEGIYAHLCDGAIATGSASHNLETFLKNDNSKDISNGINRTFSPEHGGGGSAFLECAAQDNVFVWTFTGNIFVSTIAGLLLGRINYIFGIRVLRIIAMILGCLGCLCFTFVSADLPWLIFPGLFSMTSGGNALLMSNIQVAYMFNKGSSTVVGLINGAMEISCTVILLVKIVFERGVPLSTSFTVLVVMHGLVAISTFCFMPKYFAKSETGEESEMAEILSSEYTELSIIKDNDSDDNVHIERKKPDTPKTKSSILRSHVFSAPYLLHVAWTCVCNLLFEMFIATLNPWLVHVTNHDLKAVSYYNDVLFYVMLITPVVSLSVGSMVDCIQHCSGNKKALCMKLFATAAPLYTTSLLGCGLALILAFEHLPLIYLAFLLASVFRASFYVTMSVFIRNMYRSEYFGMLYGILMVSIGITTSLQFPLFTWCQSSDSGYSYSYFLLAGLLMTSLCHPIYITAIGIRFRKLKTSAFL